MTRRDFEAEERRILAELEEIRWQQEAHPELGVAVVEAERELVELREAMRKAA